MKELHDKANELIIEMFNCGMNVDDIIKELCSIANQEDLKRFKERSNKQ
ncbi:hypothetical protein [Thomasclavelia cocleata]|nr:hypothetical protein [Thomasclavelia cocleata]